MVVSLLTIVIGFYLIANKSISVGALIACSTLVSRALAPAGQVVPVDGRMGLGFGLALRLRHALLPSACALGPVQASVSAGPGGDPAGVAYEQTTGTARKLAVQPKVTTSVSYTFLGGE